MSKRKLDTSLERRAFCAGSLGLAALGLLPFASYGEEGVEQSRGFEAWRRDFEAGVPARMMAAKVPGTAVAIISKQASTRYVTAFGYADLKQKRVFKVDTPTHQASVSKLFTASALVQLFERRGYDLHADVNNFIDFSVRNPHQPDVPITPQQLLTHTSSISDDGYGDFSSNGDPTQSLSSFLRNYLVKGGVAYSPDKSFLKAKPGAQWSYSNVAVALAGYVIESVSEQSFASYLSSNIFEPLGIDNAHWYLREFAPNTLSKPYIFENKAFVELPQEGYPDVPAGMLRCSVSNLAKMLRAMIGGETGQRAILSPRAVAAMLRRQVDPAIVSYQGLGWVMEEIDGRQFVAHSGSDSGASNMVVLTEDQNHAVAVLMNIDSTEENEEFRSAMIENLLVGAKLSV